MSSQRVVLVTLVVLAISSTGFGTDSRCLSNFGVCQYMGKTSCSGSYLVNLCDGPNERKCCVQAFNDDQCQARGGICQSTSVLCPGGSYLSGLCGGPITRRCCVSDTTFNDGKCIQAGGKCQYTVYDCAAGNYVTGMCDGPANRRCCMPEKINDTPSCKPSAVQLACVVLKHPLVLFAGGHNTDSPYTPYSNLKHMCEGRQATRKKCEYCQELMSEGVCIHENVLNYLKHLADELSGLKNFTPIVIEGLTGVCDENKNLNKDCVHQAGRAVDLRRDFSTVILAIIACGRSGGRPRPLANAVHCQL